MTKQKHTDDEWVEKIEKAIVSGNKRELVNLKQLIGKSSSRKFLYPFIYRRGRQAFMRGDEAVAEGLLYWLEMLDEGNWHAHLAAAEVRQKRQGAEEANNKFLKHLTNYPVFRYQPTTENNKITCGILLTKGNGKTTFTNGGFSLPSGLTESQHLTGSKSFDVSMVFIEGLRDSKVLNNFDILINSISDADLYYDELMQLSNLLSTCSTPVINSPEATINNTRCQLTSERAQIEHVIFPRTIRLKLNGTENCEIKENVKKLGLRFPILFRPAGTQTGEGLIKIDKEQDLPLTVTAGDYYLSEYHDFRSVDGYYRKYRLWSIGERIVHNHVLIGETWNVHGTSRFSTMLKNPSLLAEDASYVEKGLPDYNQCLQSIVDTIKNITKLDYFGVDYGIGESGIPVVFEANATMRSNYPEIAESYPHAKIALSRHTEAFESLVKKSSSLHLNRSVQNKDAALFRDLWIK